jgi:hypothetical protein
VRLSSMTQAVTPQRLASYIRTHLPLSVRHSVTAHAADSACLPARDRAHARSR